MRHSIKYCFLTIALIFGSCNNNNPPYEIKNIAGTYFQTIDVNGDQREYIVYVPNSAKDIGNVPVLFMFHGTTQTGRVHYDYNLWNAKADIEGFIVVYPTAKVHCHFRNGFERNLTTWSTGDLGETNVNKGGFPLCPGESLADDMLFIDEMLATIISDYSVDEKRIYASGMSNGAKMTARLSVERAEVFAAIAVHAGTLSQFIPSNLSTRPMSLSLTVGANDPGFRKTLGITGGITIDETLISNSMLANMIQPFLDINGLSNQYKYSSTQIDGTTIGDFLYDTSLIGETNSLRFRIIEGLKHNYTSILIDDYWNFMKGESLP